MGSTTFQNCIRLPERPLIARTAFDCKINHSRPFCVRFRKSVFINYLFFGKWAIKIQR
jgi:hypothetical protein